MALRENDLNSDFKSLKLDIFCFLTFWTGSFFQQVAECWTKNWSNKKFQSTKIC